MSAAPAHYNEDALRDILNRGAQRFQERRAVKERELRARHGKGANPFKEGFFTDDELIQHRLSRSVNSVLGNCLEGTVAEMARARYRGLTPTCITAPSGSGAQHEGATPPGARYADGSAKPVLWSTYLYGEVCAAAAALLADLKSGGYRVGDQRFTQALAQARQALAASPHRGDPWPMVADLWVQHQAIGVCEIKMGGNLDSTKALVEVEHLLRLAIASPIPMNPRIVVLYSSGKSEGQVAGALPSLMNPDHLLVGADAWERLLPEGVTFSRFLELHHAVARAAQAHASEALMPSGD